MARALHSETNKAKYGESVAILHALARQYPDDETIAEDLAAAARIWDRLP
jgi:glutathione S-transferase